MTLPEILPPLNACLNALSAILLTAGFFAIRARKTELHRILMVSAFASSTLFLISYLTRFALTGTTTFAGTGAAKVVYLSILFSHMALAIVLVPLVLRTLWLAARLKRFDAHRKLARITLPIWMYVSVTGVVVYFMLYQWPVG